MPEKQVEAFPGMDLLNALDEVAPDPAQAQRRQTDRKALKAVSNAHGFPSREPRPAPAAPPIVVTRGRKYRASGRSYRFSVKLRPEDAQFIYDLAEAEQLLIAQVIEEGLELIRERRGGKDSGVSSKGSG
jgi:hypothetical protein